MPTSARTLSNPDSIADLGGVVWHDVAEHLAGIVDDGSILSPASFKFVSEATIATARSDDPDAAALNHALGEVVFGRDCGTLCLRNPRLCSMFALPLVFLKQPPRDAERISDLFLQLHEMGATRANSYPQYRNIEMSYVAARLRGARFFEPGALADFSVAFPWMTRDQRYGLTHVMLYNSDFGAQFVEYTPREIALVEALIALADHDRDLDLMLELMLCHATIEGASERRKRHYRTRAQFRLDQFLKSSSVRDDPFGETYHPLLVACLYSRVAPCGLDDEWEVRRQRAEALIMAAFASGKPIDGLSAYTDFEDEFGPHPALETAIGFYAPLLSDALGRRSASNGAAP